MATKRLPPLSPSQETALIALALNHQEETVRQRAYALLLLAHGQSAVAIARQLEVARRSLYNWIDRFLETGIDSLTAVPISRWRRSVTPEYLQRIEELLASDPHTFPQLAPLHPAVRLDRPRLSQQLAADTGITLSIKQLRELMNEAGYVYGKRRIVRITPHFLSAFWFRDVMGDDWKFGDLRWRSKEAVIVQSWSKRPWQPKAARAEDETASECTEGEASSPNERGKELGWRITDDPATREQLEQIERLVQRSVLRKRGLRAEQT